MANLNWKIGDTSPVSMKLGVDLTGATVVLNIYPYGQRTTPLTSPTATVSDAATGTISITPVSSLAAATYTAEAVVTGTQGVRTTVSLTLIVGDIDQDVYPPDPTTPVGQTRILIGDMTYTANSDDVFSYTYFSDLELSTFLALGGSNVYRAAGTAIKQLAINADLSGISIKAADLSIDNRTRGTNLLAIATSYLAQADEMDKTDASGTFTLVNLPKSGARRRDMREPYLADWHAWTIDPFWRGHLYPFDREGDFGALDDDTDETINGGYGE